MYLSVCARVCVCVVWSCYLIRAVCACVCVSAAYPAAYGQISQAFPHPPPIIPQQQREGNAHTHKHTHTHTIHSIFMQAANVYPYLFLCSCLICLPIWSQRKKKHPHLKNIQAIHSPVFVLRREFTFCQSVKKQKYSEFSTQSELTGENSPGLNCNPSSFQNRPRRRILKLNDYKRMKKHSQVMIF